MASSRVTSKVTLAHVYISRGVVSAWVEAEHNGRVSVHNVGHHPYTGWFCNCRRSTRCPQIQPVKDLLPVDAIEAGAASVVAGATPAGACTVRHRANGEVVTTP